MLAGGPSLAGMAPTPAPVSAGPAPAPGGSRGTSTGLGDECVSMASSALWAKNRDMDWVWLVDMWGQMTYAPM